MSWHKILGEVKRLGIWFMFFILFLIRETFILAIHLAPTLLDLGC